MAIRSNNRGKVGHGGTNEESREKVIFRKWKSEAEASRLSRYFISTELSNKIGFFFLLKTIYWPITVAMLTLIFLAMNKTVHYTKKF